MNRVVGDCQHSQVRPGAIVLACADDNADVGKITWARFGGSTATGHGTYGFNGCTPNCAAGKFSYYPVKLVASGAKRCPDGHADYRKLALTFIGKPPKGSAATIKTQLFCPIP
jgi:hypothetical protein